MRGKVKVELLKDNDWTFLLKKCISDYVIHPQSPKEIERESMSFKY